MRSFLLSLFGTMVMLLVACSPAPAGTDVSAPAQAPAPTTPQTPPVQTTGPTPLAIPTSGAANSSPTATSVAIATPTQTAVATATATPRPDPTVPPTPVPTGVAPSSTAVPTATPTPPQATPTPTAVWVNPDCYVGPGAADEPVWWCGGKICAVDAPHHGCPIGQPVQPIGLIDCSISDNDIVVNEITTFTANYAPVNASIRFAFSHGDGTIDNVSVSRAYYEQPGTYRVTLLWQYNGGKGSVICGNVRVRAVGAPTPTATPGALQIGCSISPTRTVRVDEILTFTAFQSVANVPVTYEFDHGDGTLDETARSRAFYAAPGYYDVRLNWAHGGQTGTTFCGTVTVEPDFNAADYLGRTPDSAEALATSRGLFARSVRIGDQVFAVTTDYRIDRLNLEIDDNKVTKAYLG